MAMMTEEFQTEPLPFVCVPDIRDRQDCVSLPESLRRNAMKGIEPDKSFLVYAGDRRYPISEGVDAAGLSETCRMPAERNGA